MQSVFLKLSKFAAFGLVLTATLVGPFSPLMVQAQNFDTTTNGYNPATTGVTNNGGSTATNGTINGTTAPVGTSAFNTTPSGVSATGAGGSGAVNTKPAADPSDDIGCTSLTAAKGFALCLTNLVYWIGPGFASGVIFIAANFFDFVVQLSLTSLAYALDFLSAGWAIARDISNMAFLFILIYIALVIMFQAETTNTKQMLATLIIMALLVNFSFFFTRVVIDAGNIIAVQFYNAINAPPLEQTDPGVKTQQNADNAGQVRDLTAGIMNAVQIQGLFSNSTFKGWAQAETTGAMNVMITLTLLYIAVAVMYWILFFAFLQMGIKFLMRIVALWLLLIASPLAFTAKVLGPRSGTGSRLFTEWMESLVKFSLYPAVFMFIFYLLSIIITNLAGSSASGALVTSIFGSLTQSSGAASTSGTYGIAVSIASVTVRMGIVVVLLYYGMRATDYLVGQGSTMIGQVTDRVAASANNFATRTASRAGFGGAAAALRNTAGFAADRFATNNKGKQGGNILNRALWKGADKLRNSSFDVRNSSTAQRSASILGADLGKGTDKSYRKNYADIVANHLQTAENLKPTELAIHKAYKEEIEKLTPEQKQTLKAKSDAYTAAFEENQKDNTKATKEKLAEARTNLEGDPIMKTVTQEVRKKTGADDFKAYADTIAKKGGVYADAHQEAALKIQNMGTTGQRVSNIIKGLGVASGTSSGAAVLHGATLTGSASPHSSASTHTPDVLATSRASAAARAAGRHSAETASSTPHTASEPIDVEFTEVSSATDVRASAADPTLDHQPHVQEAEGEIMPPVREQRAGITKHPETIETTQNTDGSYSAVGVPDRGSASTQADHTEAPSSVKPASVVKQAIHNATRVEAAANTIHLGSTAATAQSTQPTQAAAKTSSVVKPESVAKQNIYNAARVEAAASDVHAGPTTNQGSTTTTSSNSSVPQPVQAVPTIITNTEVRRVENVQQTSQNNTTVVTAGSQSTSSAQSVSHAAAPISSHQPSTTPLAANTKNTHAGTDIIHNAGRVEAAATGAQKTTSEFAETVRPSAENITLSPDEIRTGANTARRTVGSIRERIARIANGARTTPEQTPPPTNSPAAVATQGRRTSPVIPPQTKDDRFI